MIHRASRRLARFIANLGVAALVLAGTAIGSHTRAQNIQKVTSPGGISAWLVENHSVPLLHIKIIFEGGGLQDPPDKPGLTELVGYFFNEGAGDMKSQEFFSRRDRIDAELGAATDNEKLVVTFSTTTTYLAEGLQLLELAMNKPRFDSEPLEIAKNEAQNKFDGALKNPNAMGSQALAKLIYGEHRLSVGPERLLKALETISTDDLRTQRQRLLARANAVVGVVGDIDPATLGVWLDRIFADLPAKPDLKPETAPVYGGPKRQLIEMDLPQTLVYFGSDVPKLTMRERIANNLLNSIINAPFTGRLFAEVREKRGLVYSIGAGYNFNRISDGFYGSFGSAPASAASALAVASETLKRLADDGPTEDEMANYKSAVAGQYLFQMESSEGLAAALAVLQYMKYPIDYMTTYVAAVDSVTIAEVQALARKLLRPDQLSVVVVGKPVPPIQMQ